MKLLLPRRTRSRTASADSFEVDVVQTDDIVLRNFTINSDSFGEYMSAANATADTATGTDLGKRSTWEKKEVYIMGRGAGRGGGPGCITPLEPARQQLARLRSRRLCRRHSTTSPPTSERQHATACTTMAVGSVNSRFWKCKAMEMYLIFLTPRRGCDGTKRVANIC